MIITVLTYSPSACNSMSWIAIIIIILGHSDNTSPPFFVRDLKIPVNGRRQRTKNGFVILSVYFIFADSL